MARKQKGWLDYYRQPGGAYGPRGAGAASSLLYHFPEWAGPPPGTYDPGILSQVRSSQRGLENLIEQEQRAGKRQKQDVGIKSREYRRSRLEGLTDVGRNRGYAEADTAYRLGQLGINFSRDVQDLGTARLRGNEDYERTLTDLQHRYGATAEQQLSNSIAQGTHEGGTEGASAKVRAANQAYDKGGIDLGHERQLADLATREGRLQQDYGSDVARTNEGLQRQETGFNIQGNRLKEKTHSLLSQLFLAANRATQDRTTKLSHAKLEQGIFEQDSAAQAYYAAHQLHPNIVFPGSTAAGSQPPAPHPGHVGGYTGGSGGTPAPTGTHLPHVYAAQPTIPGGGWHPKIRRPNLARY